MDSAKPIIPIEADGVPPAPDWLFILGMRTGTTALVQLLNAHKDVHILNEAWLWGYVRILQMPVVQYSPEELRIDNRELQKTPVWLASQVRTFCEGLRQAIAPEAKLFGDKAPHYAWEGLGAYEDRAKVFPGAKVVHCTRNIWDIAASCFDAEWFMEAWPTEAQVNPQIRALVALHQAKTIYARAEQSLAAGTYEVPFEGIASNPLEVVAALLEYLELDETRFDWDILSEMRHSNAIEHWKRVPEIVALREAAEA